jgi:hypothetical protein
MMMTNGSPSFERFFGCGQIWDRQIGFGGDTNNVDVLGCRDSWRRPRIASPGHVGPIGCPSFARDFTRSGVKPRG